MIGLYHRWSGEPLPAPLVGRFAASLSVGLPTPVSTALVDGATFAGAPSGGRRARGWLPARSPRGNVIMFSGHFDNRAALLRSLPGDIDPACDDTVLYGLCRDHWGDDCDLRIVGQYAAILWSPATTSILMVRSPITAPPLHYWHDRDRIIIASNSRAIFATGEVPREVDEQKIADTMFLNYMEGERDWFKGVRRLDTGTRATVSRDAVKAVGYYDPFAPPKVRFARDEEYVEAANALFVEATRAALSGFSRPAVSVSGGYDSQAVAAFALEVMPASDRLLGLSSRPEPGWDGLDRPTKFGDESAHVTALGAMYPRLDVEFVDAAGLSFDHKLDAMFLLAGGAPRNGINLHWIHEIYARAKAHGCDVVLTGAMGNGTFSFDGAGAIGGWFTSGQWGRLARELWAVRRRHSSLAMAIGNRLVMPFLPTAVSTAIAKYRHGPTREIFDGWCPLNPEWAAEMRVAERAVEMGFDANFAPPRSTRARRLAIIGNGSTERGDIGQAMSLISGLPIRDPTSYRPLLEFCFAIPDDQYLRDGKARWLAKRMLKGRVPDMVLNETRRGSQAADWHLRLSRQRPQLLDEMASLAADPAMARRLNIPRLRKALEDWPDKTPISDSLQAQTLNLAVTRALTTARFIRYVEGRNDPGAP